MASIGCSVGDLLIRASKRCFGAQLYVLVSNKPPGPNLQLSCSRVYGLYRGDGLHQFRRLASKAEGDGFGHVTSEDTLNVIKRLDDGDLTVESTETVPSVVTAVLHESMRSIEEAFVTKADFEQMHYETVLPKLRAELLGTQALQVSTLHRELETLQNDLQKTRSNHRYDMDKLTAGRRLDLNLERGHIREVLARQQEERKVINSRLDWEVADLRKRLKENKVYVINSCIGTMVTVTALAMGLVRIMQ